VKLAILAVLVLAAVAGLAVWLLDGSGGTDSDYAAFSRCPLNERTTTLCLYTRSTGGKLTVGAKTVPLSREISLQGGVRVIENAEREVVHERFLAPTGGLALSRTPEPLLGGLAGAVDAQQLPSTQRALLARYLRTDESAVTATIELAGPASVVGIDIQDLAERTGVALALPVKVRLNNPFLGSACYIGSDANPIRLAFISGTTSPPSPNHPISGRLGKTRIEDEYNLTIIGESALVDNSFSTPRAGGCGGVDAAQVDPAVNAALGLPAPAGKNTAILEGALYDANARAVRAHR
jgi:hypothetical protein